ncbi:ATP-binding cassette domain-containing protein [Microbacterium sp. NPDC089180]|uniref:ATP-binding cassette domain-containing protein n=1 Tax=Microbacterium galbum TaxID=3075994 RepID=A0ABU3T3M9_9MICO|nr:ATP-binding cassette domain-containing protein [Microbacterium sp. KSW4-17]MDU0365945.1 ATP-binding cassette domain-containing protein [Microbacterium sp. KSW4-17]
MSDTVIRARGLSRDYLAPRTRGFGRAERTAGLADVDLSVTAGSAVGIIGESGSGKSTLVRLLLGLDVPSAGSVEVEGRVVDGRGSARSLHWLRRATGIVFQDPYASLDPRMNVGRIVGEPLWALGIDGDRSQRVRDVLEQVGLDADMSARFPHEFSGGQRQRIALARAIVHRPRILVGDEPLSALDVTVRAQILRLIARLRAEEQLTLVLVSHDIGVVQSVCDQVVVMKDGHIVEQGPTEKVLLQPQAAYTRQLLASIPTLPA